MPEVQDASGHTWRVKRRWLPWRRRAKPGEFDLTFDVLDAADDPISLVVCIVISIIVIPLLFVFGFLLAEALLLLLLFPIAVLFRIAFIRSWPIEVWQGKKLLEQESVKGWRASSERIHDLVNEIRLRHSPGESAAG